MKKKGFEFADTIRIHPSVLYCGSVTITTYSHRRCNNVSCMNLSGYVGHVTIFSQMFTIACCLLVGLGLDLVSGC